MYLRRYNSKSLGVTILISSVCHKWIASCLLHQCIFRSTRYHIPGSKTSYFFIIFFLKIWRCNNLNRKITPVIFADDLFVTMKLSYTLAYVRLLCPLVIRLVIVGKRHYLFWVSSRL
jgi:hypothetical protein